MRIVTAIDAHEPFSLVRLGDGEGNFLPYQDDMQSFVESDRIATQRTWWGQKRLDPKQGKVIEKGLSEAIREADIIGIPDLYRVCRNLGGREIRTLSGVGKGARGLAATIEFVDQLEAQSRSEGSPARMLSSCHIHQSLAYWGIWDLLLPRMKSISLITCHSELPSMLTSHHGVDIGDVHLIPAERRYEMAFKERSKERHYPEVFEQLRGRLAGIRRGQVFLVAAGVLGKIYCKWIKEGGGIALDIGSAADFWCGYETRGMDDVSCYRGPAGMRERFENLAVSDPRIALLLKTSGSRG